MQNIGFIGLGIMGAPMAGHLLKGGYKMFTAVHRKQPPKDLQDGGLTVLPSAQAVAEASDIIIIMVPDTPQVEAVLFGVNGIAGGLKPGKLVIDMSSISPSATKQFAARVNALGCDYVDAPVSGGEVGAKAGSLTIMVGATEAGFATAKPILELMGKNITHVGANGDGQTTKVANQIIVALNIEAVAEALVFAAKSGADPVRVREALLGGFAASRVLEVHGERMIKRTFQPGFRIELHQKDLNLALQGARELGISLPNTAATQQMFSTCVAQGGGQLDHSAMVKGLELLANHKVGEDPQDA